MPCAWLWRWWGPKMELKGDKLDLNKKELKMNKSVDIDANYNNLNTLKHFSSLS